MKRLSGEEFLQISETHDLAFKGKDFYGFRLLQGDGRILEFYFNEEIKVTLLFQEDKILRFNRVLDLYEVKVLFNIYEVGGIRPRREIVLDFSWKELINIFKNRGLSFCNRD